jgi:hypothetical protein
MEKTLKIKINCVRRLQKEYSYYENELQQFKRNIEIMMQEDPNDYNIKKQNELIEENITTKKHTQKLIDKYTQELIEIVNLHLEEGDIPSEIIEEINLL